MPVAVAYPCRELFFELRAASGLSQFALAQQAKLAKTTVERIERGERTKISTLKLLAGILGCHDVRRLICPPPTPVCTIEIQIDAACFKDLLEAEQIVGDALRQRHPTARVVVATMKSIHVYLTIPRENAATVIVDLDDDAYAGPPLYLRSAILHDEIPLWDMYIEPASSEIRAYATRMSLHRDQVTSLPDEVHYWVKQVVRRAPAKYCSDIELRSLVHRVARRIVQWLKPTKPLKRRSAPLVSKHLTSLLQREAGAPLGEREESSRTILTRFLTLARQAIPTEAFQVLSFAVLGMPADEVAQIMGTSIQEVQRELAYAKAAVHSRFVRDIRKQIAEAAETDEADEADE